MAGSSPGVGARKDNGLTHGISLGQRRVLQGKSSPLPVAPELPGLVCLYFSPKQTMCVSLRGEYRRLLLRFF